MRNIGFFRKKKNVKAIIFFRENKNHTNDESAKIGLDGAKVALPIFIDEYTKECERKTTIENKVLSLVTMEIAILTIFMPIIPFGSVRNYLFGKSSSICISATVAILLLSISAIMMIISFGILMSAVNIRTYEKVDIEQLDDDEILSQDTSLVEKGLCDHYKKITLFNSRLNDMKAEKYRIGLPLTIVSFLCILFGTILLKLI